MLGWALLGVVGLGVVESFLTGALLWGSFLAIIVVVASVPALLARDWKAMIPWPILAVAAVSVPIRATELYAETAGYFAVAALAFIVVVELDELTPVELSRRLAAAFGVLTTMAVQALWTVAQFYSDIWLGTDFLTTQAELQEDIVIVTAVAFLVGGLFYRYVDSRGSLEIVEPSTDSTETR